MKRYAILYLIIALALCSFPFMAVHAQGGATLQPITLGDITGAGAAAQISATTLIVRGFQIVTPAGNSAVVRCGDSNVSTSRGSIIAAGGGQFWGPQIGTGSVPPYATYDLSRWYCYIGSGDKISITAVQ